MEKFRNFLRRYNRELIEERANTFEGMIVNSIFAIKEKEMEDISASAIVEEIEAEFGVKATPQKVGMYLKSLGVNSELKRINGGRKRCIIWDEQLMEKLRRRYVVEVDDGTTSGELHTVVPDVPLVPDNSKLIVGANGTTCTGSNTLKEVACTTGTTGTNTLKDSEIRETFKAIEESIKKRSLESEFVEYDLIVLDATRQGIPEDTVKDIMNELRRKGIIYEPKHGY